MLVLFMATAPVPPSEAEVLDNLLERIAEGDKEALGRLYQISGAAVYGFALSLLKDRHDAEDVQQEVYLRIWQTAGKYRSAGKPMAWIFTITRNLCLMCLREQKKTVSVDPLDWQNMFADIQEVSHEERILLASLLGALSDEERQIVVLHAMSGLRHREIANLMGLGLSTVLSKYHRAMKKLQKLEKGEQS